MLEGQQAARLQSAPGDEDVDPLAQGAGPGARDSLDQDGEDVRSTCE